MARRISGTGDIAGIVEGLKHAGIGYSGFLTLTVTEARAVVLRETSVAMGMEEIAASEVVGRFLAGHILADRDYPPFARSARDGYAVRAQDVPGELTIVGEVRAGQAFFRALFNRTKPWRS